MRSDCHYCRESTDFATHHKVSFSDRIAHFTWANFTCTQSTGGIAILLSESPRQFHGLQTAGVAMFILNMALFVLLSSAMTARLILHPRMFRRSLANAPETFYISTFWVSIETCIICMQRFGVARTGPWLIIALRVLFWIYAGVTLMFSTVTWIVLTAKSPIKSKQLHPAIFLMIINTMLTGTIASAIISSQPPVYRMPMIVAAVTYQGLGWIVTMLLLATHLSTMLEKGLGPPSQRFGLFMPVASPGFAMVSLIGCSRFIPEGYGYFARHPAAVEILRVVALWVSIFLWLVAFWIFALALVAVVPVLLPFRNGRFEPQIQFNLSWWGLIFPNVGLALATGYIGTELGSSAVEWVAVVMTAVLFAVWLMNIVLYVKAIATGQIMWPGRDEDFMKSRDFKARSQRPKCTSNWI
ncbi:voltage-dependent anion channel [Xylaria palmicola]|nr:voltage-dependent anion channel [Xylaria palmicola]